jgi:hypothetical protein
LRQVARALFDQANATRELLTIERARAPVSTRVERLALAAVLLEAGHDLHEIAGRWRLSSWH